MQEKPLTPAGVDVVDPSGEGGEEPQVTAHEVPEVPELNGLPSVFDDLQDAYAEVSDERSRVFPILPGRFKGKLGYRAVPCDNTEREKAEQTLFRKGFRGEELEVITSANLVVMTTDSIVMRAPDTGKWRDLDKFNRAWEGVKVKWDERLAQALKMNFGAGPLDPVTTCQMVFRNPEALIALASTVGLWLREEVTQAPDEDDEGAVRPI